jgi:hypothetical protein
MLVGVVKEPIRRVASVVGAHNNKGVVAAMDYDTELGHDGVSRRDIDRTSVSDTSSESTVSNDKRTVEWGRNEGGGVT